MRHALIIAGGSGTRLWPMSRAARPKQLLPFIGGRSLLQLAWARLAGLVPPAQRHVCAGRRHAAAIRAALPGLRPANFLGEPEGRDTLNAVGLAAAIIARRDPEAVIAVFTADHLITPLPRFRRIVAAGYRLVEAHPEALVTFGITPTEAATGYGYLQLGAPFGATARRVARFREKPGAARARRYLRAGPEHFLWNSGMFVWRAATLLDCIRRYRPRVATGLRRIAAAWDTPRRAAVLAAVFPRLQKISVDFAVMEPASRDPRVRVAAIPMPLRWIDVGSWPMFAAACPRDRAGNAFGGGRALLLDTRGTLAASSDPRHVIATLGCDDLIVIHTPDATLVCRKDRADRLKKLTRRVGTRFGHELG